MSVISYSGRKMTSHSDVVNGIVGSSIVVTTSTNGTPATTALNKSGRMFRVAPMSKPPALRPLMHSFSFEQYLFSTRYSAQEIKSVNVFRFFNSFPFSYHFLPISPPPRTWAIAKINPRSINDNLDALKLGSMDAYHKQNDYVSKNPVQGSDKT